MNHLLSTAAAWSSPTRQKKHLAATKIAAVLAEYFQVDARRIEAGFVGDAQIRLHRVDLLQRGIPAEHADGDAILTGTVEELELTWQWSSSSSSSINPIRDFVLTVRGARLRIQLSKSTRDETTSATSESSSKTTPVNCDNEANSTGSVEGFLDPYFQQIMEYGLSIRVADVEVNVMDESSGTDQIVLKAGTLELVDLFESALSSNDATISQRLSVTSLGAFLRSKEDTLDDDLPLVEAFSYAATIRRCSEHRCVEVIGEVVSGSAPLILHAGRLQLQRSVPILEKILESIGEETCSGSPSSGCDLSLTTLEGRQETRSFRCVLPLPPIVLVLPNDSRLQLGSSTFERNTDGSVFQWMGSGDFEVNGQSLVQFADCASWCVDLIRLCCTVCLTSNEENCFSGTVRDVRNDPTPNNASVPLAYIQLDEIDAKSLLKGLFEFEVPAQDILDAFAKRWWNNCRAPSWSISLCGLVSFLITGCGGEWMEASLENLCIRSPASEDDGVFSEFRMDELTLGPSSFGCTEMKVPNVNLERGKSGFCTGGTVVCNLQSLAVLGRIRQFIGRLCDVERLQDSPAPLLIADEVSRSISLRIPKLSVVISEPGIEVNVQRLYVSQLLDACCESLSWVADDGEGAGEMMGVSFTEGTGLCIDTIEAVNIPGASRLSLRRARGVELQVDGERLDIDVVSADVFVGQGSVAPAMANKADACIETARVLPYTVYLHFGRLCLHPCADLAICIPKVEISVSASEEGTISVDTCDTLNIRIDTGESDWFEATLAGVSCSLNPKSFAPESTVFAGVHVGPASIGQVCVDVPSILVGSGLITVNGAMDVSLENAHALMQILDLLRKCQPPSSQVEVSLIELELVDMGLRAVATDTVLADGATISCEHVRVTERLWSSTASASRIQGSYMEGMVALTSLDVETLYIPDLFFLSEPVRGISLLWSGHALSAKIPEATVLVLGSDLGAACYKALRQLPFEVNLSLDDLEITTASEDSKASTRAKGVGATFKPVGEFSFRVKVFEKRWLKVLGARVSGTLDKTTHDTILNFELRPDLVAIAAEYSALDWFGMFGKDTSSRIVRFPHGSIGSFSARLSFKGQLASTQSSFRTTSFEGDADTTSTDMLEHLKKTFVREIPSFYNNGLVFGESATDLTVKAAGRMAGLTASGAISGSALGSISALIVADSVKGALIVGKLARGAPDEEKYRFSDFPRGVLVCMKATAMRGGHLRRGSTGDYKFCIGDFSTGFSDALGKYIEENRARFGAAGGSVLGMAMGGVLYGFLGIMMGNFLGGVTGAKLLQDRNRADSDTSSSEDQLPQNAEDSVEEWVLIEAPTGLQKDGRSARNLLTQ